jgi:hypothetical protein
VVGNLSVPMVLDQQGKIALKRGVSTTDHRRGFPAKECWKYNGPVS